MRQDIGNLSRRELLKLFGIGAGASLAGAAFPRKISAQSRGVTPRGNAVTLLSYRIVAP